jgi:two-component system, response regulator
MNPIETDILLVEDSQYDAELTIHALRREHLTNNIVIAKDGEEALDFLFCRGAFKQRSFEHPPKLILLDLKLPKVDGTGVLRQIKEDPRTRGIPVVVLTSSREEQDLVRSYDLGANSYIQKPVEFEQFRQTVKTVGLYWMIINHRPAVREAAANRAVGLLLICLMFSGLNFLVGCGGATFGGQSNKQQKTAESQAVTVVSQSGLPIKLTLISGARLQFRATVRQFPNTPVTWSATAGTITPLGVFTAPAVPVAIPVTVTATSQTDVRLRGSVTVTVTPAKLTATAAPQEQRTVLLSWTPSLAQNVVSFNMYRSTMSGDSYGLLASTLSGPSFADQTVQSGATYYYVVTAVNDQGQESRYSNEAKIVIP